VRKLLPRATAVIGVRDNTRLGTQPGTRRVKTSSDVARKRASAVDHAGAPDHNPRNVGTPGEVGSLTLLLRSADGAAH
jgi:hypothetical protein